MRCECRCCVAVHGTHLKKAWFLLPWCLECKCYQAGSWDRGPHPRKMMRILVGRNPRFLRTLGSKAVTSVLDCTLPDLLLLRLESLRNNLVWYRRPWRRIQKSWALDFWLYIYEEWHSRQVPCLSRAPFFDCRREVKIISVYNRIL